MPEVPERPSTRPSQAGPDPLIGRVINERFRVVQMIARGGMGKVYRAEQAPLGREVALKVLNPNYEGDKDPEFHRRFFLEASTCAKLTHPNTVTIFDYGRTDDDVYFIAMELLEGRTLHRALRDDGSFPAGRALHVARQIARSLREAHAMGVVHRDLKPANVFLVRHGDETDFVKVLDFGLVKNVTETGEDLTQAGLFMGSPKYMAPEQIRGEKTDGRSDIYALGVMLYEMLTGKVPFDRSTSVNILLAHVHEAPPPFATANPQIAVPEALEALVMKCLAKSPDERAATMDELLAAMKSITTDSGHALLGSGSELGSTGRFGAMGSDPPRSSVPGTVTASVPPIPTPTAPVPAASAAAQPSLTPTPVPPATSRGLLIAGTATVAVLVFLIWLALGGSEPDPRVALPEHPEPATGPATVPGAAGLTGAAGLSGESEPASPLRTVLSISSSPSGAMVHVEGDDSVRYGPTPTEVEWTGTNAERGREVTFIFELEGHEPYSVTRTVTGDTLEVGAELQALAGRRPYRPRPPRRPEGDDESGHIGPVKGYKTDPY